MSRGCRFSFHVSLVTAAITFIYFSTVLVFIDQWFGLNSSPGMLNAVGFTCLAAMCVASYRLSIITDPGRVPVSFVPDIEDSDSPVHEIKRKGGDLRFCQKCSHHKPPRAHHCRICNRCVLRMDHHCVWINNCVGHSNHKIFFVFVVYAVIACIYSLVLLIGSMTTDSQKEAEESFRIIYVISGLLLVPLSLALSCFLGWHIYLIIRNKTTIEYHEGVRAMWLAEKGGHLYSHPYDVGAYDNFTSILGPNVICWICPTSRHVDSGLRFRTKKFQAELLGLPFPKHLRWNQIRADYPSFDSRTEQKEFKGDIFARQAESDAQSSKDSNSFHGDADSVKFENSVAKTSATYSRTPSSIEPSTSSVGCGATNFDIELDSPEIRSLRKPSSTNAESLSITESNYEDDLLEFSGHADYNCFEYETDDNADKELYDLLCSNGIAPSNYVLSSGRWSVDQDAQESGTKKLTIDKEFEQYFSMLML